MAKTVELKEEHIKILQEVGWFWDDMEHGGISMDSKRPFGFSGSIEGDIAEIIGYVPMYPKEGLDADEEEAMNTLYRETFDALMIILLTRSFETGLYEYNQEGRQWEKI